MRSPDFRHERRISRRPHNVATSGPGGVRLVLVSHLIPMAPGSDAGLSAIINSAMRVLRNVGIDCVCVRADSAEALTQWLEQQRWENPRPVTHCCINTYGFMSAKEVATVAAKYADIEFFVLNHSGQSFLHIDPNAMDNIKDVINLQASTHNVRLAGNNPRFVQFCADSFGAPALLLPNLYDTTGYTLHPSSRRDADPLRVGTFGALREAKNQSVAQQAALGMARRLRVHLEWHVNGKRFDSASHILRSRQRLFDNIPSAMIVEHPWSIWYDFVRIVEDCDILLMPSFDETFCSVVADGIRMGVPSVVSGAMEWAPKSWICAEPYDPGSVMRIGLGLLGDRDGAVHDGRQALMAYVEAGTQRWLSYLVGDQ
jgi:glycosyltransferase involved in cell wall biosynthesis